MAEPDTLAEVPVRDLPLEVMPYVYPSRYCQSDRLLKMAFNEFGGLWLGYSRVLAIQHWVQRRVTFTSNTSTSSTSALDTIVDQVGVCRDFAHLDDRAVPGRQHPGPHRDGPGLRRRPIAGPPDFHAYVEAYLGDAGTSSTRRAPASRWASCAWALGRDAADVAYATIFGAVDSMAPIWCAPWPRPLTASRCPAIAARRCRPRCADRPRDQPLVTSSRRSTAGGTSSGAYAIRFVLHTPG